MKPRDIAAFTVLREGEAEGGTGGGGSADPVSALEERNRALEARLNRTEKALNTFASQSRQSQDAAQMDAAKRQVAQAVEDAKTQVDIAERALAKAIDEGEGAQIATAQRALAEAASRRERVDVEAQNFAQQIKQAERRQTGSAGGGADLDTANLDDWKSRNREWYGIDSEMTRAAHEIDAGVRAAGTYEVGSKDYFNAVDRAMKQRFPDRFAGAPASGAARGEQPGSVTGRPRRYSESIQRGMQAFGMSPEQWDAARSKAAQKGLLPSEPVRDRVLS